MRFKSLLLAAALLAAFSVPCAAQALDANPCGKYPPTRININQTTNTLLQAGTSGLKIYICAAFISPLATATNIGFASGTGSVCGTGTAAVLTGGDGTAAKGANLAQNGGWTQGNGTGVLDFVPAGKDFCLNQSAANQISGVLMIVIAP